MWCAFECAGLRATCSAAQRDLLVLPSRSQFARQREPWFLVQRRSGWPGKYTSQFLDEESRPLKDEASSNVQSHRQTFRSEAPSLHTSE